MNSSLGPSSEGLPRGSINARVYRVRLHVTSWPFAGLVMRSLILIAACGAAAAQDLGTVDPNPLPPLEHPDDPKTPAKQLFGRKTEPTKASRASIGFYSDGCLDGGIALPINGPTWQVMRLSRNRNWGHPAMVKTLEDLSKKAHTIGWNGFLVGDMAQPRGGPMITGHWKPPDWPRRRRLANTNAGPRIDPPGARGDVGNQRGCDDWNDVSPDVWSDKIRRALQDAGRGSACRACAGQPSHQEGAVSRCQRRSLVAAQDPPGARS